MAQISFKDVYGKYVDIKTKESAQNTHRFVKCIDLYQTDEKQGITGFDRLNMCRRALEALDRRGWERSYHQRLFHDHFLRACARIFWKTYPAGEFDRCHEKILESNGWDSLRQEILVSTPRRFGKTISVSMFAAAMLYSAPRLEMSIYSTCKRISQKLLNNVHKFLNLIHLELQTPPMKVIRQNMEEIVLLGNDGVQDYRIVNSYPSKVVVSLVPLVYLVPLVALVPLVPLVPLVYQVV
jgi:hypothetical protein